MKMPNIPIPKWVSIGFLAVILLIAGLLAFQRSPVRVEGYLDDEKMIWYTGGQGREDPDNVGVAINWRHGEADPAIVQERMEHYVQVSRKLGKELLQSNVNRFYVGVVFRDYVSPEDFEQFVADTGIQVRNYALRGALPGVDPSVRWSFFGGPSDGKLVDPKGLENSRQSPEQRAQPQSGPNCRTTHGGSGCRRIGRVEQRRVQEYSRRRERCSSEWDLYL